MMGLELKRERIERGIRQTTLAAFADIYAPALSAFEHGHIRLSDKVVERLVKGLDEIPDMRYREIVAIDAKKTEPSKTTRSARATPDGPPATENAPDL